MATYNVTKNSDSGAGSLRQAIIEANSNPGLDEVVFDVIDVQLNSAILISDAVDITGNGAVITQNQNDRLFNISDQDDDNLIDVTLYNLTLRDGKSRNNGGAINAVENLTIDKVTLENNTTSEKGGAIRIKDANLTINDSSFRDNSLSSETSDAMGAAIYVDGGSVQIDDSNFTRNEAELGVIAINNAEATIVNSSVMDNLGLGILATKKSILNIDKSGIANNSNGGIFVEDDSKLTLTNSAVNTNKATSGAGIAISGASNAEILNSIIIGNMAEVEGGALKVDDGSKLNLTNTTIELNEAPIGSAIFLEDDSSASLLDTTVRLNTGSENELEGGDFTIETTPVVMPEEANMDLADVHRFYQRQGGFHLYTSDANEIATIRELSDAGTLPYNYEAEKFTVLADERDSITGAIIEGAKPVYRFFNTATGSHLYTMDENERGFITENLDNYSFEGIKYYAFEQQPQNIETVPVFRMLNGISGSHLFTIDQNEVNFIKENLPQFSVEGDSGIAYHVFELEAEV